MNIVDKIKKETIKHLDETAVIDGVKKSTYGTLFKSIDKVASDLVKRGIKPCDRIALMYNDSIEYIVISLAVLSINAVMVPIFPLLSEEEVNDIAKRIGINYLISEKEIDLCGTTDTVLFDVDGGKNAYLYTLEVEAVLPKEYCSLNPAFIRFSSGTTGTNKGVMLSHEAIDQRTEAADEGLKITSSDVIIWVLSMSFHFVVTIFLFLRRAATIVLSAHPFPGAMLEGLGNNEATFIYASPFHYYMLSKTSIFVPEMLSKVRMAVSTASRLPDDNADNFYNKFDFELSQAYGIIEVGLPFINSSQDSSKRASVGKMLSNYELNIVNADSEGIGEVCLRGKGMFEAYVSPWRKMEDLFEGNWFNTGDLGKVDEDGFLFLVGRSKKVINYCGMKVFPYEVEAVINKHPIVKESLVFGVSHQQYGQLPNARVVLNEGHEADFDNQAMRKFCYQHLAPYKVPKEFHCVPLLGKTPSGKLKRNVS
jgi:long-chain acyl-CoA synthetase